MIVPSIAFHFSFPFKTLSWLAQSGPNEFRQMLSLQTVIGCFPQQSKTVECRQELWINCSPFFRERWC